MRWALVVDVIGWTATVALLGAYYLVSSGRLAAGTRSYQVLNVYGAAGLCLAAWVGGVWPAVALNAVWGAIGVVALVRILREVARPGVRPRAPGGSGEGAQPAGPTVH